MAAVDLEPGQLECKLDFIQQFDGLFRSSRLAPYLPDSGISGKAVECAAGCQFGSASLLTVAWSYIRLMGLSGLRTASFQALLSANYMMKRLEPYYSVPFRGKNNMCAHEFIIDLRPVERATGIGALDIAKRLQDYSIHAPTISWPVPNSLMIEPTESESLAELDRFIEAMIAIRQEIAEIERGEVDRENNVFKLAPHTQADVFASSWDRPYSREKAAFPVDSLRTNKFWPSVNRLDDAHGDRSLLSGAAVTEAFTY